MQKFQLSFFVNFLNLVIYAIRIHWYNLSFKNFEKNLNTQKFCVFCLFIVYLNPKKLCICVCVLCIVYCVYVQYTIHIHNSQHFFLSNWLENLLFWYPVNWLELVLKTNFETLKENLNQLIFAIFLNVIFEIKKLKKRKQKVPL